MNRDALRERIAEVLYEFDIRKDPEAEPFVARLMALLDAPAGEPKAIARRARIEAYREAAEFAQGYHDGNHFDDDHSEGMRTAGRSIAFLLRQRADELEAGS